MAALLVALSVMAVMMTVALPVWKQAAQREKETELVFRGEQYARAIALFGRKYPGALPPNFDVLVEQKFLRKKYKDPITNADFVPIMQGQLNQQQNQRPGQQGAAPAGQQRPGQSQPQTPGAGSQAGGLMGVTSKSTAESIRLYKGRSHYNEWQFLYTPPAAAPGGPGTQRPGQQPGPTPQGSRPPGPITGPPGGSRPVTPQVQPPGPRSPGR